MVSYVDVCVFSQNLTTTQRLSRDEARDSALWYHEEEEEILRSRGVLNVVDREPPKSQFIPLYNGQYHIDFWLSEVEFIFVHSSVPEKHKCDTVTSYFSADVMRAYEAMQWSRIHRGEARIDDWPTLKTILRCVFLPLMEQLHTTVELNHIPSVPKTKKKKSSSSSSRTQPPAVSVSDLLEKLNAALRF